MNMNFEKPEYKITEYVEKNNYGKFELEPLERGFGTTIGNALRRVMLSSMPGSAITSVKIEGVMHEFQKMDGVVEDVTEIILNLKKLVLKNHSENDQVLHLKANKEGEVHASDIDKNGEFCCTGGIEVAGVRIKCWRYYRPHGPESLRQALMNSCNPIFIG